MGEIIDITSKINSKKIEEIYDYYQEFINLLGYDYITDKTLDNLNNIVLLKEYEVDIQNKFLEIYEEIKQMKMTFLKETKSVSDLTEIFLYLNTNVNNYDTNTLANIFAYKTMNDFEIEDALKLYNENKGVKK